MSRSSGTSNDGSSGAQDANFEQIDGGSLPENSANGGTAVDDIRVTTTGNRRRYPLTEWSKRKYAAEMQMKREMETERRANETVAECGAQVTRVRDLDKTNAMRRTMRYNNTVIVLEPTTGKTSSEPIRKSRKDKRQSIAQRQ